MKYIMVENGNRYDVYMVNSKIRFLFIGKIKDLNEALEKSYLRKISRKEDI